MKRIRDQTSTRIDIPRQDKLEKTLTVPGANGHDSSPRSASPLPPSPLEDGETMVPITIKGASSMVYQAQSMIQEVISERTSHATQKVKVIPEHVFPFVLSRRADFLRVAGGPDANVHLARDDTAKEITVSGDKEVVAKVIETIKSCMAFYEGDLTTVKLSLPKRQHRLFNAQALDEIFQKSKCSIAIPAPSNPSEDVHVWGKAASLGSGLQAVMEVCTSPRLPIDNAYCLQRANSQHTQSLSIPGIPHHSLTHIHRSGYASTFSTAHPAVDVHFPPAVPGGVSTVDFVGERAAVDVAQKELAAYLALLNGATREIQVDYLLHKIVNAKAAKQ